jgi:hypothetical protein
MAGEEKKPGGMIFLLRLRGRCRAMRGGGGGAGVIQHDRKRKRRIALETGSISGYISGNNERNRPLTEPQRKALANYRRRLKRKGLTRMEVQVRKEDAALVRGLVQALLDPERERDARAFLREKFSDGRKAGLKELLAAAPLEGIDLTREQDLGRDIDL